MTLPISAPRNKYFDGENLDLTALNLEQTYNTVIQSSIIDHHIGSGVLPSSLVPHVLFNSSLINNFIDGIVLSSQAQPSDSNNGCQLSVSLSGSLAAGNRTVKVLILGLDFENNLQYDSLTFHANETQVTSKHYTYIVSILVNDIFGAQSQSLNLGGTLIIEESSPLTLSRDVLMASQNAQPNLFFRDFFVASGGSIGGLLSSALPNYNIDSLNIQIGYSNLRAIVENDVSSQIGQKFLATTNNIQKVTLLLSVFNDITPADLVWDGDILVSIYPLQSTVSCPSDIVPGQAIGFDPSNIPLAQISVDYGELMASGTVLDGTPQPVSFIFSNTAVGIGNSITAGGYYVVTLKRAGSTTTCQIQLATGVNTSTTSWETLFNGSTWTDVPDESIWFEIWSDAAKVSDGQAYDSGAGFVIPKNQINTVTGLQQDYSLGQLSFERNDVFYAIAQAQTQQLSLIENPKTGNEVYSEQQIVPFISLINSVSLANLTNVAEPLVIGAITDQNVKTYSSANADLFAEFTGYGFVDNQVLIRVDGYSVDLQSALLAGKLNGAMFIPNSSNSTLFYRIARAELISMIYGDVDGNGIVDINDLTAVQNLLALGYNLSTVPTYEQYISAITYFVNDFNITWEIVNPVSMVVVASGLDGILTADGAITNLHSASASFSSIAGLDGYVAVISQSTSSLSNNGTFAIINLTSPHDITLQKQYFTANTFLSIFRANVSGNLVINNADVEAIANYVELTPPFPATSHPGNLVGTQFYAIRLLLEEYVDRADDYPSIGVGRSSVVHPLPDVFLDGYTAFQGMDLQTTPLSFEIVQQLVWNESCVVANSNPRLVEASINYQSGFKSFPPPPIEGVVIEVFPSPPAFDPGRNDIFIPNNLIINNGGQIINNDGYMFPIDFEVANFVIEIPQVNFNGEQTVNLFSDLVSGAAGNPAYTRIGYPALRFSDNSFVGPNALTLNQVRFAASMQSSSPQLNGQDGSGISGIVVDSRDGVSIDYATGLLTLQFYNRYIDPVQKTLSTKIQITIYLKKAGWNNAPSTYITATTSQNWLGLG